MTQVTDAYDDRFDASRKGFVEQICREYPTIPMSVEIQPITDTAGFSGAKVWKLTAEGVYFCLKRWPPEHPSQHQLEFIHRVIQRAVERGVHEVAAPVANRNLQTYCRIDGSFWEVSHWMPGKADYHSNPAPEKLAAALQVLARFHNAVDSFPAQLAGPPPGLTARLDQMTRLLAGGIFHDLRLAVQRHAWPTIRPLTATILETFQQCALPMKQQMEFYGQQRVPLQPCIRDIWHDHILFEGNRVTGVIDFGALRQDHIAADLSRLLGSLVRDDATGWSNGLAAYQEIRPLSMHDLELVKMYDRSSVLLSAINWLTWICVDQRHFPNAQRVVDRLAELTVRLTNLAAQQ